MNCDYCDEQRGIDTVYNRIYGSKNRIVYDTRHFSVFPCMGQLREGHLLATSKEHVNAIGMLSEEAICELEDLAVNTAVFFQRTYGQKLFCFEHGVLDDCGHHGGCGIYHMHLHMLPMSQEEFSAVLKLLQKDSAKNVRESRGLLETRNQIAEKKTYVFLSLFDLEGNSSSFIVTDHNNYFESQYMRKIVCEVLKKENWDWRQAKKPEPELLKTLEKSHAFYSTVKDVSECHLSDAERN